METKHTMDEEQIQDLSPEELIMLKGELKSLMIAVDVALSSKDRTKPAKDWGHPSFLKVCRKRAAQAYARLFKEIV